MLGHLIGGFVVVLVGVNLLPSIANAVQSAVYYYPNNSTGATNVTGASIAITQLVTVFFALGIMAAGVSLAVGGLQQAGIL